MDVRLKVLDGPHQGEEIAILTDLFVIGRGEECHLRPQSDLISRRHCALVVNERGVTLREFGSKNGTFVDGVRVNGERPLKSGDRLRVGQLEFELLIRGSEGDAASVAKASTASGAAAVVETRRPPAAETMQFAPPTINDVGDTSTDENPSGAPPADESDDKKSQNRLRKFFLGE